MTLDPAHVVHVSSAHPWTDNRIHFRECVSLSDLGYRVSLIGCARDAEVPSTPVDVIKLPRLPRGQRVTVGAVRAIAAAIRTRAKVVHLHDPELVWAVPVLKSLGRRVIYDAHEDLPAQVMSKSYIPRAAVPLARLLAFGAIRVARMSDHVVAATETVARRYPAARVSVVHNYPPLRPEEGQAISVLERPPSLVYVGGIGPDRGSVSMLEALADENFPKGWSLHMAGTTTPRHQAELERLSGWAKTHFHGNLAPHDARDLLLQARVGIVVLARTPAYLDSLPTKMFEYFAAGLPVVASDFPLWRAIIERYDCGILVNETSPASIARAVATYAEDPALLARHSAAARRAALETYNWSAEVPVLARVYQRVLHSSREA